MRNCKHCNYSLEVACPFDITGKCKGEEKYNKPNLDYIRGKIDALLEVKEKVWAEAQPLSEGGNQDKNIAYSIVMEIIDNIIL